MSSARFKRLQQATGFNLKPEGLLLCQPLRSILKPATMLMYDWMHVYMVSGAFNHEAGLLLSLLHQELRISNKEIHIFVNKFTWPKLMPATGKAVFEKRSGTGELKCSASEGLSCYSLLRLFIQTLVVPRAAGPGHLLAACSSFVALCNVIDILRTLSKGTVNSSDLHAAVVFHLNLYKSAYTVDQWYPKLHYALHLGTMLEQHGCLVSCFVHERKHKELKRTANMLQNTSGSFEKTILQNCLYSQVEWQKTSSLLFDRPSLNNPRPCTPGLVQVVCDALGGVVGDLMTSRDVTYTQGQCASEGDVVRYDTGSGQQVGQVLFHVSVDGTVCTCIKPWISLGGVQYDANTAEPVLFLSSCILDNCIHCLSGDIGLALPC